jgi:hypothetical protein
MIRPYERLWTLIEASMPDPGRFTALVGELGAEQLIALHADVIDARSEVREKWEGPYIPDLEGCLSEDSCEDFTDWVVGQGYEYWRAARGRDDEALAGMFAEDVRERSHKRGRWHGATPAIGPAFYASFDARFDNDKYQFLDAVDAELEARAAAQVEDDE